ncbi:MAG: AraC family transcriptional regulator [Verrucomicrobia bacterium]|nr:AraC family transcriptional regulator [Verrucomicrobiota bacterium]
MLSTQTDYGVEFLEARFQGHAYQKHRHDTYAISLTTVGIQSFTYRGASHVSIPGQVVVLHPDELHDGYAGTEEGFGYRQIYVEPALIFEALQTMRPHPSSLPFVRTPVTSNQKLSAALRNGFQGPREPLALDSLIVQVVEGLVEEDPSCQDIPPPRSLDVTSLNRVRQYLDTHITQVVHSSELEAITGLTRYDLARQFRVMCGTSPYRYLLRRRLDFARTLLTENRSLVEVAIEAGFADQAHFSRMFKATFGITPGWYRAVGVSQRA